MADLDRSVALGPFRQEPLYARAVAGDQADALAGYRDLFAIGDPDEIYLDGNSLGRMPIATSRLVRGVVDDQWGEGLITSWNERWWPLAQQIGDAIAPIVGGQEGSIVVADSTSVALFKLAWAALDARPERTRVVTDDLNFPTDIYVLEAAAKAAGERIVDVVDAEGSSDPMASILDAIDEDTALVSLSHVAFKSGYLYDADRITHAAHQAGAMVLWDLSHSVGVVPIDLAESDMAVGCTYKYLNGGPGSPAFVYVNPQLSVQNPLAGWWGHRQPFAFDLDFKPAETIARFQTGTMPILSLAAVQPGVEMTAEAGIPRLRAKSVALSDFLIELADQVLAPLGYEVGTPRDPARRGSHVALHHSDAWRINQAMIDVARVVPDFREPDIIRLGLAPLYTGFVDVHTAVHRIAAITDEGILSRYQSTRTAVT